MRLVERQHLQEISKKKPNEKNRADPAVEQAVVSFAYDQPAYGQLRVSNELKKQGIFVSPGGIRSIWLRHDLAAFKARLRALEAKMVQENLILTESQLAAMERAQEEKEARGEIETEHPGYLGARDTYYAGNIKGVGHIYQQTFTDTYTKAAFCKLYGRKNALAAADMLNDVVIPFFDSQEIPLLRILTDRGSEYCGNREHHEYVLYLDLENIEHTRIKARHPQTNGIYGRFNKTCKDEFYSVAFRKKVYRSIEGIQLDLNESILPILPGVPERQTNDYYRHGTTTLFAALDVLTGNVIGECKQRHTASEYISFLKKIDKSYTKKAVLHIIADNYATHKTPEVKKYLESRQGRFVEHFIPTHSSWLNLAERWFAEITNKRIRRESWSSVRSLEQAIRDYIKHWNKSGRRFQWTKTSEHISNSILLAGIHAI